MVFVGKTGTTGLESLLFLPRVEFSTFLPAFPLLCSSDDEKSVECLLYACFSTSRDALLLNRYDFFLLFYLYTQGLYTTQGCFFSRFMS